MYSCFEGERERQSKCEGNIQSAFHGKTEAVKKSER